VLIILEHTGVYYLKLANYLYEIELKLKILEDLQQKLTMLRNIREVLAYVPMKNSKRIVHFKESL